MDPNKQQILERLNQASNVLVTVSANPSIDQLASCIGLTLFLNKLGKHATAVFSGEAPSTIEFLEPEATLERNTNSLRDFIISLDKAKADKLRYKVEENIVKIFITPYRTSLSEADLNFSQGDFNVDAVVAIGVHEREELDEAITAHGRILHDADVISINISSAGGLGTINWVDPSVSSLSEMVASLVGVMKKDEVDSQIATALLTGIVAETERFSNERTSPQTMAEAAKLMEAGANQQLIATKLQPEPELSVPAPIQAKEPDNVVDDQVAEDGTLSIAHTEESEEAQDMQPVEEEREQEEPEPELPDVHIDEHGEYSPEVAGNDPPAEAEGIQEHENAEGERPAMIFEPPTRGGTLTATGDPDSMATSYDPLSQTAQHHEPILSHDRVSAPTPEPLQADPLAVPEPEPIAQPEPVPEPVEQAQQPAAPVPSLTDIMPSSNDSAEADVPSNDNLVNYQPTASQSLPTIPVPDDLPVTTPPLPSLSDDSAPSLDPIAGSQIGETIQPSQDSARDAVANALSAANDYTPTPISGLGAQPLGGDLHQDEQVPTPIADILAEADNEGQSPSATVTDTTLAPEVPPPLLPDLPPLTSLDQQPGLGLPPISDEAGEAPASNPLLPSQQ